MYSANKTLDLFWRTVEACGIPLEEADKIIHSIEKKHGVSIGSLPKSHSYKRYNVTNLKKEDIEFINHIKGSKLIREFCRRYGINRSTLLKAVKRGNMSMLIYDKFTQAKEEFSKSIERIEGDLK